MNSTSIKIKKFLSNRNTVTIICAFIGIVVLYVGYTMKVQSAIEPIEVPHAKVTIQPRTKIKDDMIGYIEVASAAVEEMGDNIIICNKETCPKKLVGRYTAVNTLIPQGSLFYESAVVDKDELPDAAVYEVKDGETLYNLSVNMSTTYVNSIIPGGYIDIYIRTIDEQGMVRVGKFIENIKILAVKTSSGLNVFENSEEQRVPAYVLFALPNEQYLYLSMAAKLGLEIIPVPINVDLDNSPETSEMTSKQLYEYIQGLADEFAQGGFTLEEEDPTNPLPPTDPTVNNGTKGE
ncbi:MAG: hypothetical protein IJN90_03010 [Bacilli bacterium]|nr:hypothetical protein [Bacilli bacterium]